MLAELGKISDVNFNKKLGKKKKKKGPFRAEEFNS